MRKSNTTCLLASILLLLLACGQAYATGVLFVHGGENVGRFDENLIKRLQGKGFEVTIKKDDEVAGYHAEGQGAVVISGTVDPGKITARDFRALDENIVCLKPGLFYDLGLTEGVKESDFGYTSPRTELEILDPSHPLAASFSGKVKVSAEPFAMAWGSPGADGFCVASPETGSGKCGVLAYEAGTAMPDQTAPARRVGLFAASGEVLTDAGWVLFDTAVDWATQHVDDDYALKRSRNVADFMGWKSTPLYSTDVEYKSSDAWESSDYLPIINYEPGHYAHFTKGAGGNYDIVVNDNSFRGDNLKTDLPDYQKVGGYVEYILGIPEATIHDDLKRLKAAGFKGVRLYASDARIYALTILAAHDLKMKVYLTVAIPDISNWPLKDTNARLNDLYNEITRQGPDEGTLQRLHFIINFVTKSVFSETVPLVFFGNESLLQPDAYKGKDYTDQYCTTLELKWGINLVRDLLKKELENESLPAVTTPILSGQVVQVGRGVHDGVARLVSTIQKDINSPIAYTTYPFQWASRYYDADPRPYRGDSGTMDKAYPEGAKYYDRWKENWTSGPPIFAPVHTVREMVTDGEAANILFSLKWMVDRVNWIWGGTTPGGVARQLIAETGWPSDQPYSKECSGTIVVKGNADDAKEYFSAVRSLNYKVDNCPILYFAAFDEPLKDTNNCDLKLSEKHYGIYRWTGIPKFFSDNTPNLLQKPFAVLSMAPPDGSEGVPQMRKTDSSPTDTQYTITFQNGTELQARWYLGSTQLSDTRGGTLCKFWHPNVIVSQGDTVVISSPVSKDTISLVNSTGTTISYSNATDKGKTGENLKLDEGSLGASYKLYLNYKWTHGNLDMNNTAQDVYADWWAN